MSLPWSSMLVKELGWKREEEESREDMVSEGWTPAEKVVQDTRSFSEGRKNRNQLTTDHREPQIHGWWSEVNSKNLVFIFFKWPSLNLQWTMGLSHTAADYPEYLPPLPDYETGSPGENVDADRMEEKESANSFLCRTKRVFSSESLSAGQPWLFHAHSDTPSLTEPCVLMCPHVSSLWSSRAIHCLCTPS